MKIKKGDTVLVITGEGRGRRAEVIRTLPKEDKVIVKGVNIAKKHAKPRRAGRKVAQAGIIDVEMPISVSNVKLVSPSGKPTRVSIKIKDDGSKVRYSNKLGEELN